MPDNVTTLNRTTASVTEAVKEQITDIASKATDQERKAVVDLISRAQRTKFGSEPAPAISFSPAMAAIIFLSHNPHNRDWHATWSQELARRITTGLWDNNNATVGFYVDGLLEDGQHRLAACALSGIQLLTHVIFGISRQAIVTVDTPHKRTAADAATLDGILEAPRKQVIIKSASAYLVRAGDKEAALKSESEIRKAIADNNSVLDVAIDIGRKSCDNFLNPVLKPAQAESIAYLMLKRGWPEQRIREKLALFQSGQSSDGERTPYFVGAEVIQTAREKKARAERLNATKELGVVVYAMIVTEQGVKAVQPRAFKAAVAGKELPDPSYPAAAHQQAAE